MNLEKKEHNITKLRPSRNPPDRRLQDNHADSGWRCHGGKLRAMPEQSCAGSD
jgi:hypothetical protein